MKRNIIYKGLAALLVAGTMASCSEDYLDVQPVTNFEEKEALGTVTGARLAMDGVIMAMNCQYQSMDWNGTCGEAYINTVINDAMGADAIFGLWGYYTSYYNWGNMANDRTYANCIPWMYYYGIINKCNRILYYANITDETSEDDVLEYHFVMAQALTMRAHSYQKLLSLYGPRLEDSKGGKQKCIVLRLQPAQPDVPLSTFGEVMTQIYKDLDQALEWYDEASKVGLNRVNKWDVNANVAHGIYARTALINHDWEAAYTHAAEARKGYTIMDADTYCAGFYTDNSDFIWHCEPGFETTYYWSWGSHYSCNGGYLPAWEFGAGAINIDLYNATDPKDIRRALYLTPDKVKSLVPSVVKNPGKIKADDFWNSTMVDPTNFLNLAGTNKYSATGTNCPGMYDVALWFSYDVMTKTFKGDISTLDPEDDFYDYHYELSKMEKANKDIQLQNGKYGRLCKLPFGAQYKFWSNVPYGNMALPWMRASEMALVEAEAYYMAGDETKAKKALKELMSQRVSGYNTDKTGADLLEEIRVNRRMELFMEGQSWTDAKRWNISIERRKWVAGDPTSGNAAPGYELSKNPSDNKGWVLAVPYSESDYNKLFDRTELPQ